MGVSTIFGTGGAAGACADVCSADTGLVAGGVCSASGAAVGPAAVGPASGVDVGPSCTAIGLATGPLSSIVSVFTSGGGVGNPILTPATRFPPPSLLPRPGALAPVGWVGVTTVGFHPPSPSAFSKSK